MRTENRHQDDQRSPWRWRGEHAGIVVEGPMARGTAGCARARSSARKTTAPRPVTIPTTSARAQTATNSSGLASSVSPCLRERDWGAGGGWCLGGCMLIHHSKINRSRCAVVKSNPCAALAAIRPVTYRGRPYDNSQKRARDGCHFRSINTGASARRTAARCQTTWMPTGSVHFSWIRHAQRRRAGRVRREHLSRSLCVNSRRATLVAGRNYPFTPPIVSPLLMWRRNA